jgi:GAF domain-containing protein
MAEAREIGRLVADASDAVATPPTLELALEGLAMFLSHRYAINRISVRTRDHATDETEIVGVWTTEPTQLGPGVRMPARATSLAEVELRGGAVLGRGPGNAEPLLDQLIRDEGNRSWVVMPLVRDRLLAGLLSVSSKHADAFTDADLPFFEALADAIQERILDLASSEPSG